MSAATLPLRLARREVRRRPGRTLLVALLVAVPVAGMAGAVTLLRTDRTTPAEQWASTYGHADASVEGGSDTQTGTGQALALPDGSRTVAITSTSERVRTVAGLHRSNLDLSDQSLVDPLTAGMIDLLQGRPPTAPGEIALAPHVARVLGVGLGDTLALDRPTVSFRVVGLVERPSCLDCDTAVVAPGQLTLAVAPGGLSQRFLVDLPALSARQATDLRGVGGLTLRVDAVGPHHQSDGRDENVRWSLVIGAVVLMIMGIVISAAFAVGARRQLVTLGQLAASGASPATLRASLVLQGTLTGAIGVVAGFGLAGGALFAGRGQIEEILGHRIDHFVIRPADQVTVLVIALVAATVAALIPARTAASLPTLAALAGRRPLTPVPARLVAGGFAAVTVGLGLLGLAVVGSNGGRSGNLWALVAIIGGVCELLGACAIAPALVARLEPLAGRVHGSWRIAARGLARNRTRTGAVVAAVAAAGALAIVSAGLVRGTNAQNTEQLEVAKDVVVASQVTQQTGPADGSVPLTSTRSVPDADTLARFGQILPGASRTTVRTAALAPVRQGDAGQIDWTANLAEGDQYGNRSEAYQEVLIADPAVLDAAGLSADGRAALRRTGMVLLQPHHQRDAELVAPDGTTYDLPVARARHSVGLYTSILMTEAQASALHLTPGPAGVLFLNPSDLHQAQRDAIEDIQLDRSEAGTIGDAYIYDDIAWQTPRTGPSPFQLELLLTGLALVFSLFVVGASLALAAAESKDERDVLTIAGAPPAALARAAGARAWLLSGIGGLLAVPIGFLPVVVYSRASTDDFPLVFPGRTVALLLLAVPTVVGAVALAGSATAQRLRPVRVSTATFE